MSIIFLCFGKELSYSSYLVCPHTLLATCQENCRLTCSTFTCHWHPHLRCIGVLMISTSLLLSHFIVKGEWQTVTGVTTGCRVAASPAEFDHMPPLTIEKLGEWVTKPDTCKGLQRLFGSSNLIMVLAWTSWEEKKKIYRSSCITYGFIYRRIKMR